MKSKGIHIISELSGCNFDKLNDSEGARLALIEAAKRSNATVVYVTIHRFEPQGLSGIAVIAESHISLHTWPELGYAAIDIYTCGEDTLPERGEIYLAEYFEAQYCEHSVLSRGLLSDECDKKFIHRTL